jgi:pimeloyl-ACP methyl ester carboxylesterase
LADSRLDLFFTKSDASQAAGRRYIERISRRSEDRDIGVRPETAEAQAQAFTEWCATDDPDDSILGAIDHPVLIVNGSHDTILRADNSYALFKRLPNAQLILYPDSGHGSLFQYPDRFVVHATQFLSEPDK